MQRTAIYARVSTEDQVEKYGLPSQLRACREQAQAQGLNVIVEITDDGISGIVLERPGLDRLRAMVRNGELDIVLMYDADRLSRRLVHLLILKPEIERFAQIAFVAAKFEDSPSGRLFFGIRGVIGEFEREQTRERTMRGKRERARAGLIVGGRVAYGYKYAAGRLCADEERAPIVRRIFADYAAGLSVRAIARDLRQNGAPSWSGRKWGHSSVRRILVNETYAGVAHYGTHRREGKLLRLREPSERIALIVPALVSRELWTRVQGRLASNPLVGRPSTACLLRGLLYCGTCGRRMYGESGKRYSAYRCSGRDTLRRDGAACEQRVGLVKADAAVWDGLVTTFTDPEILRGALSRHADELRDVEPGKPESLRAQVLKLKRKEETAIRAMLDPDLVDGQAVIKAQYRALVEERRRAEAELASLDIQQPALSPGEWLDATVQLLREYIGGLTDQAKRIEFVRRMVSRAEWLGEEIRMQCFISPQLSTTSSHCGQFDRIQVIVTARVAA